MFPCKFWNSTLVVSKEGKAHNKLKSRYNWFFFFHYKQQEKTQIQKDLWRIEDVTAGLSANKANYKTIVDSIKNPGKENVMGK